MDFDCGDKVCFVEHKLSTICKVYLPDSSPNCSIPCQLDYCSFTNVNEILCPIYHCTEKTTTESSTTTMNTETTTFVPDPNIQLNDGFIVSLFFNGLSIFCLMALGFIYLRKILIRRIQARERNEVLEQRLRMNNPYVPFSITDNDSEHQDNMEERLGKKININ
jgi:hypothetical protein